MMGSASKFGLELQADRFGLHIGPTPGGAAGGFSVETPPGIILCRRTDLTSKPEPVATEDGVLNVVPTRAMPRVFYEGAFDSFFDVYP